jgi:hypothetical protein
MNDHEIKLIDNFIINSQKERYRFLFDSKKRHQYLKKLHHFEDYCENLLISIPPDKQNAQGIYNLLKYYNVPNECYIISTSYLYDMKYMKLDLALKELLGNDFPSIISCIPGKLVFYEGEAPSNRFILKK